MLKLLNLDGSEFGEAPAWLQTLAPAEVGRAFIVTDARRPQAPPIAFVRLSRGLRFYCEQDRRFWLAAAPR